MADADAEHKAARKLLAEGLRAVGHRHRVAGVDVGDAGRDDHMLGSAEQQSRVNHDLLAAEALGHPDGRVTKLLEPGRRGGLVRGRQSLEREAPDVQRPEQPREVAAAETAKPVVPISFRGHARMFANISIVCGGYAD